MTPAVEPLEPRLTPSAPDPWPGWAGPRLAVAADVTGDGVLDVVYAAGRGGGPEVKVYDGTNGVLAADVFVRPFTDLNGVSVGEMYAAIAALQAKHRQGGITFDSVADANHWLAMNAAANYDVGDVRALERAANDLTKLPRHLLDALSAYGWRLVLVSGDVTDYPKMAGLRGLVTYGFPYTSVAAATLTGPGGYSVVAVNKPSGSVNTVLHEAGLALDVLLGHGNNKSYADPAWQRLWKHTDWDAAFPRVPPGFLARFADEAWGEGFAAYFGGAVSREALPAAVRHYFDGVFA